MSRYRVNPIIFLVVLSQVRSLTLKMDSVDIYWINERMNEMTLRCDRCMQKHETQVNHDILLPWCFGFFKGINSSHWVNKHTVENYSLIRPIYQESSHSIILQCDWRLHCSFRSMVNKELKSKCEQSSQTSLSREHLKYCVPVFKGS